MVGIKRYWSKNSSKKNWVKKYSGLENLGFKRNFKSKIVSKYFGSTVNLVSTKILVKKLGSKPLSKK